MRIRHLFEFQEQLLWTTLLTSAQYIFFCSSFQSHSHSTWQTVSFCLVTQCLQFSLNLFSLFLNLNDFRWWHLNNIWTIALHFIISFGFFWENFHQDYNLIASKPCLKWLKDLQNVASIFTLCLSVKHIFAVTSFFNSSMLGMLYFLLH